MAGKGDKPRNCFSKKFRENYDEIDWRGEDKADRERNFRFISGDEPRIRKQQGDLSGNDCERFTIK